MCGVLYQAQPDLTIRWCRDGVPCDLYIRENIECIKSEDRDGRRKLSYKRKIASLEKDRTPLLQLVEAIRKCDEREVKKLTDPIKRCTWLVEIERIITEQFGVDVSHAPEESQGINNATTTEESGIPRAHLKVRRPLLK